MLPRHRPWCHGWLRWSLTIAERLDQKGTSLQRLRVAKGHELPKVVRYQRMQVTKSYEIPMVASIKRYEEEKVPMTKGCIVVPRMQCIVIQDLRSCRDPRGTNVSWSKRYERIMIHGMWTGRDRKGTNGSGLKGYERIGTEKGTSDSMVNRTPHALCWAWTTWWQWLVSYVNTWV